MRRNPAILILALTLGACAPAVRANPPAPPGAAQDAWVGDRLYFGRSIPQGGGTVSDSAWAVFLAEVVTPRFPDGLTAWRAEGQWRDGDVIVREGTFVLELFHPAGAEADTALNEIAAEYRRRFSQKSVMRVRASADVIFH